MSSQPPPPEQDPISQEHRTLAAETKKLRMAHHWTREQLAQRTGIPSRNIYRIESMQRKAALDEALALARAFGVAVETLTRPDQGVVEILRFEIVQVIRDARATLTQARQVTDRVVNVLARQVMDDLPAVDPLGRNPYTVLREDPASAHRLDVALRAARLWLEHAPAVSEALATLLDAPEGDPGHESQASFALLSGEERTRLLESLLAAVLEHLADHADGED